jgi:Phospholipid methyltransferase
VHAGQTVIEARPYHYLRDPAHAGARITVIGLGLALGNWASLFTTLACVSVGYADRIRVKEAAAALITVSDSYPNPTGAAGLRMRHPDAEALGAIFLQILSDRVFETPACGASSIRAVTPMEH